jgi:hypothetical protein
VYGLRYCHVVLERITRCSGYLVFVKCFHRLGSYEVCLIRLYDAHDLVLCAQVVCDEITGLGIPSTLPCDISSWPSALQCSVISYSQWLLSPYHTSLTVFSLVSGSITSISFIDDNVWLTASAYSMTTCSTSVCPRQHVMLLAVSVSTIRVCSPHYLIANTWRFLHPPIPANCPLIFFIVYMYIYSIHCIYFDRGPCCCKGHYQYILFATSLTLRHLCEIPPC